MNKGKKTPNFLNKVQELNKVQMLEIGGGDLIQEDANGNDICPCGQWSFAEGTPVMEIVFYLISIA